MADNFKKAKKVTQKGRSKKSNAALPNLQNGRGFTPLRKAVLERKVKQIIGKIANDCTEADTSHGNRQPIIFNDLPCAEASHINRQPHNFSNHSGAEALPVNRPPLASRPLPQEENIIRSHKEPQLCEDFVGEYMDFAVAVSSQNDNEFMQSCSNYLNNTKRKLQQIYLQRTRLKVETDKDSPSEQPKPEFDFSPVTSNSLPAPTVMTTLKEAFRDTMALAVCNICPYCVSDGDQNSQSTVTQSQEETKEEEEEFPMINVYFPHKF